MRILIIGVGYVGLTTGLAFAEKGNQVDFYDIDQEKIEILKKGKSPFFEQGINDAIQKNINHIRFTSDKSVISDHDIMFIAVPTPMKEDGSSDLKYVNSVLKDISSNMNENNNFILVTKSTVPVGTNKIIQKKILDMGMSGDVISNPEFLSQGTAFKDSLKPHRIILGGESATALNEVEKLYLNFDSPILKMSFESAELVKYASNTFQALKISFINEMANISEAGNANIKDVAKGMSYDPVIGDKFLRSGIGYGGSCFPKDTKSLSIQAETLGVDAKITKAIIATNNSQVIKIAKESLKQDLNIGILGLSFKPDTDDPREAPTKYIIEYLNENDIIPYAYDPKAMINFKKMYPNLKFTSVETFESLIEKSNTVILATEWGEFKDKSEKDFKGKFLLDGRGIYPFADYQVGKGYKNKK